MTWIQARAGLYRGTLLRRLTAESLLRSQVAEWSARAAWRERCGQWFHLLELGSAPSTRARGRTPIASVLVA